MPRIADILQSLSGATYGAFIASLLIGLGQFTRTHVTMGVLVFLVSAVWNNWAIWQSNAKLRNIAWLATVVTVLLTGALFVAAFVTGVNAAMAGKNSPRGIETVTLPTGEVLMNEFKGDDDGGGSNKLFFQANASAPYESLGELDLLDSVISLHQSKPMIFREDDREALVIGSYVFERWARKQGPYWGYMSTNPDFVAGAFLRTFLKPGDPRIPSTDPTHPLESFGNPEVKYIFDRLDLGQNVLVTRREPPETVKPRTRAERTTQRRAAANSPDNAFPEFLVYSAPEYGYPLAFDLNRTRALNGLPTPDTQLSLDVSVVTFHGDDHDISSNARALVLAKPGAKEIFAKSFPLNGENWTKIDYAFDVFPGRTEPSRFEAILGFLDPVPHQLSVFWRAVPGQITTWHFAQTGQWVNADESGFADGTSRIVFFRVEDAPLESTPVQNLPSGSRSAP